MILRKSRFRRGSNTFDVPTLGRYVRVIRVIRCNTRLCTKRRELPLKTLFTMPEDSLSLSDVIQDVRYRTPRVLVLRLAGRVSINRARDDIIITLLLLLSYKRFVPAA